MSRIMVVDDDKKRLVATSEFLGSCGYEVVSVEDVAEAYGLICSRRFDLVLTAFIKSNQGGMWLLRDVLELDVSVRPRVIIWQAPKVEALAKEAWKSGTTFLAEESGYNKGALLQEIRRRLALPVVGVPIAE